MKKKPSIQAHTAPTKFGMGDGYGTGARQKMGKLIEGQGIKPLKPKKLLKAPKSLA